MKASKISVLTLMACALAACSSTDSDPKNKLFDYKAAAVRVRSLEVPPDLTAFTSNDRYNIPGADGGGVARYSEFSKGGGVSTSTVLPVSRTVRLMRKDAQRWLLVNDKAENIWPVVKAFWEENGLAITIDNPQAGIIETDWAENRAKIPMEGMRKAFGSVLDSLYASGERDQYHTRLERSPDGNSTEIYIQHNGLVEVQDAGDRSYKWLSRANDPELEATMLQLLMTRLAGGAAVMADGQQPYAAVDGVSTTQAQTPAAKVQAAADGSKSIFLSEPFDKSWRKVSLALEQAGIAVEDKDRSKGVFFLRAAKNADKDAINQVNVRESAGGCEVTVSNGKGAVTPDAQRVMDTLYQQLGKQ